MEFFAYTGLASITLLALDLHDFFRSGSLPQPAANATVAAIGAPAGLAVAPPVEYDRAA